jgi:hypothetical protein
VFIAVHMAGVAQRPSGLFRVSAMCPLAVVEARWQLVAVARIESGED